MVETENMRVLAIDTSHATASVAVVEVGASPWSAAVLSSASARASNAHGESLIPIVEGVLRAASLTLVDVDLVAVGIGPGSFTGTRVGVATAKGIALGGGKPLAGVEGFEALAAAAHGVGSEEIAVAIDARKGEVYLAAVRVDDDDARRVGEALHAPPSVAWSRSGHTHVPRLACGDGARLVPELATRFARTVGEQAPSAAVIAALAGARRVRAGAEAVDELDTLEPFYVRPPDITVPKSPPGLPRDSR